MAIHYYHTEIYLSQANEKTEKESERNRVSECVSDTVSNERALNGAPVMSIRKKIALRCIEHVFMVELCPTSDDRFA